MNSKGFVTMATPMRPKMAAEAPIVGTSKAVMPTSVDDRTSISAMRDDAKNAKK